MVDPVNTTGSIQSIQSANKAQDVRRETQSREGSRTEEPRDEVSISQEAQDVLSASQAEEKAGQTGKILAQNQQETLGLDPNFDQAEDR